jgi:hypothetical protein
MKPENKYISVLYFLSDLVALITNRIDKLTANTERDSESQLDFYHSTMSTSSAELVTVPHIDRLHSFIVCMGTLALFVASKRAPSFCLMCCHQHRTLLTNERIMHSTKCSFAILYYMNRSNINMFKITSYIFSE